MSKIALFIDGINLWTTARSLKFDVDFDKLRLHFGRPVRAFYYTTIAESTESDGHKTIMPLLDWLDYNGYTVVTKDVKVFTDNRGIRKVKGNMDIELAVDAMELAPHIDHAYIFSGDGEFTALVLALQRKGVVVTVVSTIAVQPHACADELRRAADEFIDLNDLRDALLGKPRVNRYA